MLLKMRWLKIVNITLIVLFAASALFTLRYVCLSAKLDTEASEKCVQEAEHLLAVETLRLESSTAELESRAETAKALYNTASTEFKDAAAQVETLVSDIDAIAAECNDITALPERIVSLRREYAAKIRQLEDRIMSGESDRKIVYITVDDGPYRLTDGFLETFEEYGVRATFFTIGRPNMAETYRRELAAGHMVQNHTYSHAIFDGLYSSVDSFMTEVHKQDELLYEITGFLPDVVRFPGGSPTAGKKRGEQIKQALYDEGYGWINWDVSTGDGSNDDITVESSINRVKSGILGKDICVILIHDYSTVTYNALPGMIEHLREEGYMFLPLFYESVKVNKGA